MEAGRRLSSAETSVFANSEADIPILVPLASRRSIQLGPPATAGMPRCAEALLRPMRGLGAGVDVNGGVLATSRKAWMLLTCGLRRPSGGGSFDPDPVPWEVLTSEDGLSRSPYPVPVLPYRRVLSEKIP